MTRKFGRIRAGQGAGGAGMLPRTAWLLVAGLAWGVAPAAALMPPYVYENARRDAASVIVLEVQAVTPPAEGYGACRVTGVVRQVERGTALQPGGRVTLDVPCVQPGAQPPIGGTIYQSVPTLAASRFGRAWLNGAGEVVLSLYQVLTQLP